MLKVASLNAIAGSSSELGDASDNVLVTLVSSFTVLDGRDEVVVIGRLDLGEVVDALDLVAFEESSAVVFLWDAGISCEESVEGESLVVLE